MGKMSQPIEKSEKRKSLTAFLYQRVHILQWLPKYKKSDIIADFIAGLTVGITMIPQAIAYANLAGLPAQYGLYTAFIGSFTYVIFGTIKEVSIGPTSLMAFLTLSYTEGFHVDYVILLTLLVGLVEILLGVLNLGFLVEFISPCVTSGFTSAMSITITLSQVKNLLGLTKLTNYGVFDVLVKVASRYNEIKYTDTLLGLSCIVVLFSMRQLPKIQTNKYFLRKILWFLSISRNAVVVLVTSVLAFYLQEIKGISPFNLSGTIPSGIPQVHIPNFSVTSGNETVGVFQMTRTLGTGIVIIPISAILANVAIAKSFASGVIVDATQEMITLGLCNVFGSLIQAMPSCGAFTRSAVVSNSGVRTPLQGIYSGLIILLALSFLTPYFFYIPRTTLAAVLISAIVPMFDYEIFPKLWKCNKFDFFITSATLLIAVCFSLEKGILLGALLNLIIVLKLWTRPKITKEIRLSREGVKYIYIKPEIGLYYSATDFLTTQILEAYGKRKHLPIVLDCSEFIRIDYAACLMIENMIETFQKKGETVCLLNLQPDIYTTLANTIRLDNLKVCQDLEDLCNTKKYDYEIPLLEKQTERKGSDYDNI